MTALQRSPASFRRQGSSGRIWEQDRRKGLGKKSPKGTFSIDQSDNKNHPNRNESFQGRSADSHSLPSSPSNHEPKAPRCSFPNLFCGCLRSK
ncbi:hypothetical protein M0R45_033504 [Rubus argutus]|uniref:Uncharacterized protein n=1 Tax=Rubus argutus TaxID=59490 RepID=A0AAW1WNG9_RUBAR